MGRRDRERKLAIQAGELLSIRQTRDRLMFQAVRKAQKAMFDRYYDDNTTIADLSKKPEPLTEDEKAWCRDDYNKNATEVLVEEFPRALGTLQRREFHEDELTSTKGWRELFVAGIDGVLASSRGMFGMVGRKDDTWKLRRKGGKLRSGTWDHCLWCGRAIYKTPSTAKRKWHNRDCYLQSMKWRRLTGGIE